MENMTDKQMEVILNLVADKFAACKDMDEVKKAIEDVREMAKGKTCRIIDRPKRKRAGLPPLSTIIYKFMHKYKRL